MKKHLLAAAIYFAAIALPFQVKAQISEGGQPTSFQKFFKGDAQVPFVEMPSFDLAALQAEDAINDTHKGPWRFGYNHFVNLGLTNSGNWTTLENGDRLWRLGIRSANAMTINLAFNNFYLPEGAKLFLYNADRTHVIGAFTNKNNQADKEFGADLINGSSVIVEYFEPAAVAGQGTFNLFRVTHGYRSLKEHALRSYGDAGNCQINVNCTLGNNWQDQKRSVAVIVVGGNESCTGALVNNTANDGTPYFLSANHCGTTGLGTWVFRFNWESATCTNANGPTNQTVSGATLRANWSGSDFCLMELNSTPPASYNVYYAGWTRDNVPATSAIAIHHPSGDIKKISEAANSTISATWSGADCWRVGQWTQGCTEPGSSGSPLFDQNYRIVGQLYGGPSACGQTAANMNDYYGKFATSWAGNGTNSTRLSNWLDPLGTAPLTLDGYDPNATPPAYNLDAAINAVSSPATGYSSCLTDITPSVTIRNYGADTLTMANINYQVDAQTVQTFAWTGSLATNTSATITLPIITGLTPGAHTFTAYTTDPNAGIEENTANDTTVTSFTITTATPLVTIPQSENFQSAFPSANWSIDNPNSNDTWVKYNGAGGFGNSTSSARMDNYNNDITGESDYILSPFFDFSTASSPLRLSFDVAYARYNSSYYDSLYVWAITNCDTWTQLYAKGNTSLATAPDNNSGEFVPSSTQWRTEQISLNSLAGQTEVRFAFENASGYGQMLYLDNINIQSTASFNEVGFESMVEVFPNPAQSFIQVTYPANRNVYRICIMNSLGQNIIKINTVSGSMGTSIDISSLAQGVYYISIENGTSKALKKLVKQ